MFIALYFLLLNVVVPQIGAILEPIMVIVITLAGIIMLFGAVGIKISNNLGSTIVGGFFRGIGYLCRTLFQALAWIVRNTFRMIPRVFNGSRRTFNQTGLNPVISNLLATIIVFFFVAIII